MFPAPSGPDFHRNHDDYELLIRRIKELIEDGSEYASTEQRYSNLVDLSRDLLESVENRDSDINHAFQSLVKTTNYYRSLFCDSPVAAVITDLSGIIREINRSCSALLRLDRLKSSGIPMSMLISRDDHRSYFAYLRNILADSEIPPSPLFFNIVPRGGESFIGGVVAMKIRDADREGIVWMIQDVSTPARTGDEMKLRREYLDRLVRLRTRELKDLGKSLNEATEKQKRFSMMHRMDIVKELGEECGKEGAFGKVSAHNLLTKRELQVLTGLSLGRSCRDVAAKLQLSIKTIETHRLNIMKKLNLYSVAELTAYAIKEGIISV